jgi:hypothetical protein
MPLQPPLVCFAPFAPRTPPPPPYVTFLLQDYISTLRRHAIPPPLFLHTNAHLAHHLLYFFVLSTLAFCNNLFEGVTATGTLSDSSPAFYVLNVSSSLWQYDRWFDPAVLHFRIYLLLILCMKYSASSSHARRCFDIHVIYFTTGFPFLSCICAGLTASLPALSCSSL